MKALELHRLQARELRRGNYLALSDGSIVRLLQVDFVDGYVELVTDDNRELLFRWNAEVDATR